MRCQAITRGGTRCTHIATAGGFCHLHDPARAEQRRRAASRGGRAGGNGRRSGTAEIEGIKADIQRVIDVVADGTVQSGAVLFMGYNVLLRACEVGRKIREADELEARISQLEAYAGDMKGQAWRR